MNTLKPKSPSLAIESDSEINPDNIVTFEKQEVYTARLTKEGKMQIIDPSGKVVEEYPLPKLK